VKQTLADAAVVATQTIKHATHPIFGALSNRRIASAKKGSITAIKSPPGKSPEAYYLGRSLRDLDAPRFERITTRRINLHQIVGDGDDPVGTPAVRDNSLRILEDETATWVASVTVQASSSFVDAVDSALENMDSETLTPAIESAFDVAGLGSALATDFAASFIVAGTTTSRFTSDHLKTAIIAGAALIAAVAGMVVCRRVARSDADAGVPNIKVDPRR